MGHRRYAKRGRQRYSGDLCLNTIYEAGKTTSAQPPMAHDIPPQAIDYHVAVICVLEEEAEAVRAAFDHRWDLQDEGDNIVKHHGDKNQYNTGVIFKHNVVLATPDKYGKGNATRVIAHLRSTFPGIRWCLAVVVCGGCLPRRIESRSIWAMSLSAPKLSSMMPGNNTRASSTQIQSSNAFLTRKWRFT